jgi:hypothetical protein
VDIWVLGVIKFAGLSGIVGKRKPRPGCILNAADKEHSLG